VKPAAKLGLGVVRLAVAAAFILVVAYVLSWQILWVGMAGNETPFHLHLIDWVATSFPNLPWWYQWDGMGVSYREAYPLASSWLTVAASYAFSTNLEGGAQVIQFALMPSTALGLYAFFDWRLRRPLAGVAAALLFMLSPIGWVEWAHAGLYASWVGMVLFMPALIALDAFFVAWLAGDRSWKFRVSGVTFVVVTTVLGVVSPHLLAAPVIAAFAYALALPRVSVRSVWRWLFMVVPALCAAIVLLSAFWLVAEVQYLSVVRSHWAGAGTNFDPARLWPIDLGSVLSLQPLRDGNFGDLYSFTPAALLPALLGVTLVVRDGRARLLVGLSVVGIALMTFRDLYRPMFAIPGFAEFAVVAHRPPQLLASIAVPALAALGLFEIPRLLAGFAARRWSWPGRVRVGLAIALPVVIVIVLVSDVYAFAGRVDASGHLAYGPSEYGAPDLRDLWLHHPLDVCPQPGSGSSPLCSDQLLSTNFSVSQLVPACVSGGQVRTDAPVCRGLRLDDPLNPRWDGDPGLIAQTAAWCAGRNDPVCAARYLPVSDQLLDPRQWRPLAVTCQLACPARHQALAQLGAIFPSPPVRAELNSRVDKLDMAFHTLVGGGITHSYNDQVIPSHELASWLEESMLVNPGSTTKSELAAALGVDAVVLSPAQADRAADYRQMGWVQVSSEPIAFVNPRPSGLAAQWPDGTSVLVVGGTQSSVPALYNFVFERATSGILPFASAWLVRGPSPNIDDYSDAELSRYSGIILLGYQYHDQTTAWSRLDRYVRGGGHLFVETGWQYVDPDWNLGSAPATLPVPSLQWGSLDPSAPVLVDGSVEPQFGRFVYGSGGWGASSAGSLRPGASQLVKVGDRVVVARWQLGKGRVVWSGMNLFAHDASSGSADEDQFVTQQLAWLFAPAAGGGAQISVSPDWHGGDQVSLALRQSSGPSLVLLKESLFPGWSARLVTPTGTQPVRLVGSEMDFMLATLGPVPAGSRLVFTYGPTEVEVASWWVSAAVLVAVIAWMVRPALYVRARWWIREHSRRMVAPRAERLAGRAARWGEEP
jgi:hypothetical protein